MEPVTMCLPKEVLPPICSWVGDLKVAHKWETTRITTLAKFMAEAVVAIE